MRYGPQIVTDGLVLYMDAANNKSYPRSGTSVTDVSTNDHTGTLTNGVLFTNNNGGEFDFDGVDDYINHSNILGDVFTGTTFTLDVWIKPESDNIGTIWGKYGTSGNQRAILFRWFSSGTAFPNAFDLGISTNGAGSSFKRAVSSNDYPVGFWYNVVLVWDNSQADIENEVKIYVNGELSPLSLGNTTMTGNDTIFNSNEEFRIGWSENQAKFDGKIPTTKVYDRNLSSLEVLQNFDALKHRFI